MIAAENHQSNAPAHAHRPRLRRHALRAVVGAGGCTIALLAGCSSTPDPTTPGASVGSSATGTVGSSPTTAVDASARLATAKTVAVGFFQSQAVNDFDEARKQSSGAASLTIDWAEAVNTLTAANGTPYQIPTVTAPNARVQIDSLDKDGNVWRAKGFVEISARPGTVASTTTLTAPAQPGTTIVSGTPSTSTFITDLVFTGDGDQIKLADYRLDDTAYPISELFTELDGVDATAADAKGSLTLARRNLDGSVQYIAEIANTSDAPLTPAGGAYTPTASTTTAPATVFADAIAAGATDRALVVIPGAFPGAAGTLSVGYPYPATPPSTTAGSVPPAVLTWTVPDWVELTARTVNTIREAQASSTTTSSSTTSSAPSGSTTSSPSSSVTTTSTPTSTSTTTSPTTTAGPTTTSTGGTTSTTSVVTTG